MSGEHTHPEYAYSLTPGWRDYTGKATDPLPLPAGAWVDVPGCAVAGSPIDVPHEEHMLYARLALQWAADSGGADGIVECRYLRDGGDGTAYDERHYAPGTDSIPFQMVHFEVGERGIGGHWQLKLSGALTGATVTTRYAKVHSLAVDWL